jgi:hypothetical protein
MRMLVATFQCTGRGGMMAGRNGRAVPAAMPRYCGFCRAAPRHQQLSRVTKSLRAGRTILPHQLGGNLSCGAFARRRGRYSKGRIVLSHLPCTQPGQSRAQHIMTMALPQLSISRSRSWAPEGPGDATPHLTQPGLLGAETVARSQTYGTQQLLRRIMQRQP